VGAVFPRDRLFRELEANRGAACTWVAAPPGAGKTTLLASFVEQREAPCLWYQIDSGDADVSAFFPYLTNAALVMLGHGAAKALPRLPPEAAFSTATFARQFFRELFASAPRLLLVLDDYHEAPLNCPLHEILRNAIEQTPTDSHIAVISRTPPPRPLARALTSGAIRSLGWEQLRLTTDDVIGMARVHKVTLDAPAASHWLDRCGAWAAGLRLLLHQTSSRSESEGTRLAIDDPPQVLFNYFGEEVFRRFPEPVRLQLLTLAVLPRIPADIVNELAGATTAEAQLRAMAEQNLFTTLSNEDGSATYRFHPLFRDFLLHHATGNLSPASLATMREGAAEALHSRGLVADAAQVLIDARAWDRLCALILGAAQGLMSQGRHATVGAWLAQLPPARIQQDPWMLYWLGASQAPQNPAAGRSSLERAFDLFGLRQDRAGLLLAWSGVVDCIFREYADANQLGPWIARLDELLTGGEIYPSPEIEAKVTFSMFVALSFHQPQHPEHSRWRSRLVEVAEAAPDPMFRLLAHQHVLASRIWSGDLRGAAADLQQLKRELEQRPLTPLVELIGHLSESTLALYCGDSAACFNAVEKGLGTAQASGIHVWDKILLGQGAALALSHGDLERGKALAQRRAANARRGDAEEQSLFHALEAWIGWLSGKRAEALLHVERSIDFSKRMGLPHFHAVGLLAVAIVSFECGAQDAALSQLHEGRALGTATRNPMILWMADLLEAYVQLCRGEDATPLIDSALAAGREHGYRHFFFWPRHAIARVCAEALVRGIRCDDAVELIDKGHVPAPPEAIDIERWPWPLKVFTLGRFAVVVRGKPLQFEGKVQHGPLTLLKVVIALGGHDISEHSVVDAMWPEAAGDAGEQSLATTLSRLRKLIGAQAIKRQDGRLSLEPTSCWVDCWALERALLGSNATREAGGPSLRSAGEQIARLYRGHFLHADDQAPWAMGPRERMHVHAVASVGRLAQGALDRGDAGTAIQLFSFGLDIDDLVEDFYLGLMRCHALAGQTSQVVATYRRCQRVLGKRLGVTPAEKTTRVYLAAIEGKG
jgi:ATP/maltotriose-dependent transcriptional regulator MalT/DNA-binding SARP family transcriptional activator